MHSCCTSQNGSKNLVSTDVQSYVYNVACLVTMWEKQILPMATRIQKENWGSKLPIFRGLVKPWFKKKMYVVMF